MTAHYVYRIYDNAGRLLYVGCTQHLFQRLGYHRRGYSAWWISQAAKTVGKVYRTKAEAREAERIAIATEHPRWNITGKWQSNPSWSEDDFVDYVTALVNSPEHGEGTQRRIRRTAELFRQRTGKTLRVPAQLQEWWVA